MALPLIAAAGVGALAGAFGSKRTVGMQQGVDIDPNAFKIADADKYRQQAFGEFDIAKGRGAYIQPKQRSFIESLEQQAAGQGPSLAGEQLKAASNRSLSQQLAAAQASRNPNAALTQRGLQRGQAEAGGQLAEQSAIARMQEQRQAQQMLGTQITQESQAADQLTKGYLEQGFSMAQAQQQAAADLQRLKVQQALGLAGVNAQIDQFNSSARAGQISGAFQGAASGITGGMGGMFGGGGGGISGMIPSNLGQTSMQNTSSSAAQNALLNFKSDETHKTEIADGSKEVSKFLDHLSAKTYKYKDPSSPGAAEGRRFGIMAQDLEKSEMGRSVVRETANGKMIDGAQSLGLIFAAQAELNKRLKNLESKKD